HLTPALTPRCMTSKLPAEERCNPDGEIVGMLEEQAVSSLEELDGDLRVVRGDAFQVPSKPKSVGGHQLRVGPRIWLSPRHHENLTPQLRIQSEHVERLCVSEDLTAEARWGRAQVHAAVLSTEGPVDRLDEHLLGCAELLCQRSLLGQQLFHERRR